MSDVGCRFFWRASLWCVLIDASVCLQELSKEQLGDYFGDADEEAQGADCPT